MKGQVEYPPTKRFNSLCLNCTIIQFTQMQLEQQVVSLDLAKRLKELGVKQESYFWWTDDEDSALGRMVVMTFRDINSYSAFTVAELGEMLGDSQLWKQESQSFVRTFKANGLWWCELAPGSENTPAPLSPAKERCVEETEADARAKMLVYLLENKLITL